MNSITAVYGGDTTYGASTSAPFNQTVLLTGTTTSLAASTATPAYGQPVTFSVTVGNVGAGSGTPSGDVEFYDGTTDIGSATLDDSGDGSLTVSTLTAGPHSITAVYQGDGNLQRQHNAAALAARHSGGDRNRARLAHEHGRPRRRGDPRRQRGGGRARLRHADG